VNCSTVLKNANKYDVQVSNTCTKLNFSLKTVKAKTEYLLISRV